MIVFKRSTFLIILSALLVCGFLFSASSFNKSDAQRPSKWQYCALTQLSAPQAQPDRFDRFIGTVDVNYFQSYKSKNEIEKFIYKETITAELNYGEFLQENGMNESFQSRQAASQRASEVAFAKALTKLGNDGWEIVGNSFKEFDFTNINGATQFKSAIYFKRAIN